MKKRMLRLSKALFAAAFLLAVGMTLSKSYLGRERLVAELEDKCQIYEHRDIRGRVIWETFIDGKLSYTVKNDVGIEVQFITFCDGYAVFMSGSPYGDIITVYLKRYELEADIDKWGHFGMVPADEFTIFPIAEKVEIEENGEDEIVRIAFRYHEARDELAEESVVYGGRIKKGVTYVDLKNCVWMDERTRGESRYVYN